MPELNAHGCERPKPDEVRLALNHMADSEAFRGSPQLVAFLRYVVEATLRGEHDRIKGYTIALEALGRAEDFDPQSDPIVRVEAIRLRRAITRYYASGGARDPVLIDLPLGSYVPVFRRGNAIAPERTVSLERSARRRFQQFKPTGKNLRRAAAGIGFVLLGASAYAVLDFWFDFNTPNPQPISLFSATQLRAAPGPPRAVPAYPVVFVGAFQSVDSSGATKLPAEALRGKLRDALARFDEVQVVSASQPGDAHERASDADDSAPPGRYALTASVESEDSGVIRLNIRLSDGLDGRVAYARSFSH